MFTSLSKSATKRGGVSVPERQGGRGSGSLTPRGPYITTTKATKGIPSGFRVAAVQPFLGLTLDWVLSYKSEKRITFSSFTHTDSKTSLGTWIFTYFLPKQLTKSLKKL